MTDLLEREHKIIEMRRAQMALNWLCYKGGQEYINKRLMRGIHEDDRSWFGKPKEGILPRKERSHYVPYAERIVDKIEEYIWSKPIKRDGADKAFVLNADRTGMSVDEVLQLVQEYWTVCGWGWINVDRTGGEGGIRTLRDKERENEGIYWTAYAPWEVPDWHYGPDGRLEWAISERSIYDNTDPMEKPFEGFLRTLWFPGHGIRYTLDKGRKPVGEPEEFEFSCDAVPFVRIGEISPEPHWFDNVEGLACALMNLESEAHTNLSKGVYSIPVIPAAAVEQSLSEGLGRALKDQNISTDDLKTVIEKVFSRSHPITETEECKGVTRFVSPPSGDLTAYPAEIERTKKILYEVVGLGVSKQKDTADAESADAKQFDHLDINAVLRERALSIQRLETRAVQMSLEFDSTFPEYEPIYPTEFSVADPGLMVESAERLKNLGVALPRKLLVAIVRAVAEMIPNVSESERQAIEKEVDEAMDEEDAAIKRIAESLLLAGKNGNGGNGAQGGQGGAGAAGGNGYTPLSDGDARGLYNQIVGES